MDENPSAEQVIVVKTAKDNIHYIANSPVKGDKEAENLFVQRLLEANPKNAEALMLLQGEGQLIVKKVEQTMPAK